MDNTEKVPKFHCSNLVTIIRHEKVNGKDILRRENIFSHKWITKKFQKSSKKNPLQNPKSIFAYVEENISLEVV